MIVGTGTSWRHGHRSSVQRSVAAGVGGAGTSSSTTPRTEPPLDPSGYSGVTITGGVGSELAALTTSHGRAVACAPGIEPVAFGVGGRRAVRYTTHRSVT